MCAVGRLRKFLLLILAAAALPAFCQAPAARSAKPLTVADDIAFHRIVTGYSTPALVSPDGRWYLLVLQSGDLARNGSWLEFYRGGLDTIASATPVRFARLFTTSTEEAMDLAKDIRWAADSRHISFVWDDGKIPGVVQEIDTETGKAVTLARATEPISEYSIDASGREVYYTVGKEDALPAICRQGGPITTETSDDLLACYADRHRPPSSYETYVAEAGSSKPRRVSEPSIKWVATPEMLVASPDGRFAVAVRPSPEAPAAWDGYRDHILKEYLESARADPSGPRLLRHLELIDARGARSKSLWDAPHNPYSNAVWSPDSKFVVVGPTFLPLPTSDEAGLTGKAVAVIDVTTGSYSVLPIKQHLPEGFQPIRWTKDGIELGDAEQYRTTTAKLAFKKTATGWKEEDSSTFVKTAANGRVKVEVREDYNTPAALYAGDGHGAAQKIFEPNPDFAERFALGRTELIHWKGTDGRPWSGTLTYPVGYERGKQYPLVIQTHGYLHDMFPLSATYLSSVFAAQEFANCGIATVQLGGPDDADWDKEQSVPTEPELVMAGQEGVIADLAAKHLIDPQRVGITGFSRTGWHTEYFLTHSKVHLAAAEIADSMDTSFFQYLLSPEAFRAELDQDVGGPPYGAGLKLWEARSAVFQVEKITTPLRIEGDSGPMDWAALAHWDLLVLLRRLHKPVEYFIVPDIAHGVHVLQNPAQRFASMSGTLDWYRFWLKGEEDPSPSKAAQYERWRELRKTQEENDKRARAAEPPPNTN